MIHIIWKMNTICRKWSRLLLFVQGSWKTFLLIQILHRLCVHYMSFSLIKVLWSFIKLISLILIFFQETYNWYYLSWKKVGFYDLPPWSISTLQDCKMEVFNTVKVIIKLLFYTLPFFIQKTHTYNLISRLMLESCLSLMTNVTPPNRNVGNVRGQKTSYTVS